MQENDFDEKKKFPVREALMYVVKKGFFPPLSSIIKYDCPVKLFFSGTSSVRESVLL